MRDDSPAPAGSPVSLDEEINYRPIWIFIIGLFATCAFSFVLIWGSVAFLNRSAEKHDPALPEARRQGPPPEPHLEASPPATLRAVRAEEQAILDGWGWADPAKSRARIPITRAMEIVAAKGLPARAAAPVAPSAVSEPAVPAAPASPEEAPK